MPGAFGATLLLLGLILTLAPYFSGQDFGVIKIPDFSPEWRRKLKGIGPIVFVLMIGIHIPFLTPNATQESGTETKQTDSLHQTQKKIPEGQTQQYDELDETLGQNKVEAEIVGKVKYGVPKRTTPVATLSKYGENILVGLVTIEARTANFTPVTYLLEWVLITPDGSNILLDSYRENKIYKFTQRRDALITLYWVYKTIWADNLGTYEFRVYTSNKEHVATATFKVGSESVVRSFNPAEPNLSLNPTGVYFAAFGRSR